MAELLTVAIALTAAVAIGLWLFSRYSTGGDVAIASFGLLRNATTFLVGFFLLLTGSWIGILLGGLFIILAVFLGSTHASNLEENTSIRKKIAG